MAKNISNITTTETFQAWFDKTNELVDILNNDVLTASSGAGDTTVGNATLIGTFTANTMSANTAAIGDLSLTSLTHTLGSSTYLLSNSPVEINTGIEKSLKIVNANAPQITFENTNLGNWNLGIVDSNENTSFTLTKDGLNTDLFEFKNDGSSVFLGELSASGFNSTSDISLKKNVETLENSIEVLKQLNPVSFNWKRDNKSSYGLIAQELEQIMPELIVENNNLKHVSYIPLIALLISAVIELESKIANS